MPNLGTINQIHNMPPEPVAIAVLEVLEKHPEKFPLEAIVEVGISFEFRENYIPLEFYDFHSHVMKMKMTDKVPYTQMRVSYFTAKGESNEPKES